MRPLRLNRSSVPGSPRLRRVAAVPPLPAAAAQARIRTSCPTTRVQDLHYGDVLFYFYQDDDFEAITRLNAYEQWGLLPHHDAESQLLLGGLYLSLGLHNEAGKRFEAAADAGHARRACATARGSISRRSGTRAAISSAPSRRSARCRAGCRRQLEAEKQHLFANILLRLGRFDEAVALLQNWRGPADWMAYAQFNLGVALVRDEQARRGGSVPRAGRHARDRAPGAAGAEGSRESRARLRAPAGERAAAGARSAAARAAQRPVFEQGAARHGLGAKPRSAITRTRSARGWSCAIATCSTPPCRNPISPCRTRSAS